MGETVWGDSSIKAIAVQKAIIKDLCHEAIKPLTKIIYKLDEAQDAELPYEVVSQDMFQFSTQFRETITQFKTSAARVLPLSPGPQPWADLIRETVATLLPSPTPAILTLPTTAFCHADPQALKFITHEIIQNAVRHHPQQAPRLEVILLEFNEDPSAAPYYQLIVTDDGPGIDPAQLRHIWESENPMAQSGKNGLIAVNYLVTAMGGLVFIENNTESGITLRLQLPKA